MNDDYQEPPEPTIEEERDYYKKENQVLRSALEGAAMKHKRYYFRRCAGGWTFDLRCFNGWLVIIRRDVFVAYWSTDATPPTRRDGNGRWIIGSYGKWAQSRYS